MALTQRQIALYTDLFDLYKPNNLQGLPFNDVEDISYPSTPTYSNVSCYHHTKDKIGKGKFFGNVPIGDTVSLMDTISFDCAQEVGNSWVLQKKTTGDPEINQWYIVTQDPDINNFHANKQRVYIRKLSSKPPDVA